MSHHNVQHEIIVMSLQPMFEQAEAENLWFYHESDSAGRSLGIPEIPAPGTRRRSPGMGPRTLDFAKPIGLHGLVTSKSQ